MEQIKDEIKSMKGPALQELSTLILQLKRAQDPERKAAITQKLDDPERKWIPLEEVEKRLAEE